MHVVATQYSAVQWKEEEKEGVTMCDIRKRNQGWKNWHGAVQVEVSVTKERILLMELATNLG